MESPLEVLRRVYGYESFRPPQDRVIQTVLEGRDAFVLMPTGGGKSLCYQIPAMCRSGTALVVSPLISLMKDQVDALRGMGVNAAVLNSSLSAAEASRVLTELRAGDLDMLYVAPERLMTDGFLSELSRVKVSLVAIDEAHCVSQWGHDFRPEYVQLGTLRRRLVDVPFIGLTATADAQTREDVLLRLGLRDPEVFISGFDRPNIRYTVVPKTRPAAQLLAYVRGREDECGIVYCLSRKRVESVAADLRDHGIAADAYHAGLTSEERARVQEAFRRDETRVVVATVAFGMGIDKPNVRYVVHHDLPKNVEGYYQETGRAGRDGLPSEALLLYSPADAVLARRLISMSENEAQKAIELRKLSSMVELAEASTCRRRYLLGYFGETGGEACGNCDICLSPPETFDATDDAKSILMTVYDVKQRFGVGHVVQVLRGSGSEKLARFGHDSLPRFGSGAHRSADEWEHLIRQLVQHGYLAQDTNFYNVLKLTPKTKGVLREGERLELARPPVRERAKRERKSRGVVTAPAEAPLAQALRQMRRRIAEDQGVPPYVIFGDVSLQGIVERKPRTMAELMGVSGMGEFRVQRYGAAILEEVARHA